MQCASMLAHFGMVHVLWSGFFLLSYILLLFGFVQFVEAKIKQDFQVCIKHTHSLTPHQQKATAQLIWLYVCLSLRFAFFRPLYGVSLIFCCCDGSVIAFVAQNLRAHSYARFFPQYISNTKIMGYWTIISATSTRSHCHDFETFKCLYYLFLHSGEMDALHWDPALLLSSAKETKMRRQTHQTHLFIYNGPEPKPSPSHSNVLAVN